MKVTINIDMTPIEARLMMGLPDVQPMQEAAMAIVEKRMKEQMEKFSAEGLLDTWLRGGPELFKTMMGSVLAAGRGDTSSKPK
jgi:hypothetical protein